MGDPGPAELGIPRPKSIVACSARAWTIHLRRRDGGQGRRLYRYRCRSWRHAGPCRRHRASVDFARIRDALEKLPASSVTYLVLTLRDRGLSRDVAFRSLWRRWQSLYQWIRRRWGGKPPYVATVEAHLDGGWPHVNALLVMGEEFGAELGTAEDPGPGRSRIIRETKVHALHAGERSAVTAGVPWGYMLTWDRAESARAVAGYILKIAGQDAEDTSPAVVGEVVKLSQVPVHAPPRFRRIRASRGFLAPQHRGVHTEWTGQLWQLPVDDVAAILERTERAIARWKPRKVPSVLGSLRDRGPARLPRGPPREFWKDPYLARRIHLRRQLGLTRAPRLRVRAPFAPTS